jgi:hypothetical protein
MLQLPLLQDAESKLNGYATRFPFKYQEQCKYQNVFQFPKPIVLIQPELLLVLLLARTSQEKYAIPSLSKFHLKSQYNNASKYLPKPAMTCHTR